MPTVSLLFQSYPTCPGSESWAQSHHHPEQVQTCRFKNAQFVWLFAVLVEDPLFLLLKPSKKEIPMAFYMAKMYVCLSLPQNTWYPGEQEDLSDSMGNRGDPGSPSLGHTHIRRDLPLLLSSHFLGQRSACLRGGSSWTGGVLQWGGDLSEHTLFLHPWSSQITAEDGGCRNTVRRVKSRLNCNYLKLLRQNPCDVA